MAKSASLNHAFKLVWSHVLNAWVAVSEVTKGRGKSKAQKVAAVLTSALFASASLADPTGGVITSGSGSISQTTGLTTIHQTSQNLNVNWQTFNVNAGQTVNFVQPSSTALAVNRIFDTNGSRIMGNINANGRVWLINPNGVFFGQGSQVNVGSLLASTLNPLSNIDDATQVFGKGGKGSIINQGTINASNGYVAFIGNTISNTGSINATNSPFGNTVAFGAGSKVSLKFADNQLLGLTVDQSTLNNLAENKGLIQANGGAVLLSAGAKDSLLASVVNNEGIIEAKTVDHKNGKIILLGGLAAGTANVAGTLDASAVDGDGGFIETSAAKVKLHEDSLNINAGSRNGKAGTWVIDPKDFTIAASGGDMTGAFLSQQLQNQNVQIFSMQGASDGNGDIHVNDTISWTSGQSLELLADRNINVNKAINGTLLALTAVGSVNVNDVVSISDVIEITYGANANYSVNSAVRPSDIAALNMKMDRNGFIGKINLGASASEVVINGNNYTIIRNRANLENIANGLTGRYVLAQNIDLGGTEWAALGQSNGINNASAFTGQVEGLGHTVDNLLIAQAPALRHGGLFNTISDNAILSNLGVSGAVHASVSGVGTATAGGLVGAATGANGGTGSVLRNVFAKVNVTGNAAGGNIVLGGLVGDAIRGLTLNNAFAMGSVRGATQNSATTTNLGGLVGRVVNAGSSFNKVFAEGDVSIINTTVSGNAGGLIGSIGAAFSLTNAYATGKVSVLNAAASTAGGLIGIISNNSGAVVVDNVYATGMVSATGGTNNRAGGLLGNASGVNGTKTISNAYWDATSTGQGNAVGSSPNVQPTLNNVNSAAIGTAGTMFPNLNPDVWNFNNGTPTFKVFASALSTIALTYNLNPLTGTYTYSGMGYDLANLWSATTIFGADYSTWLAGTDYTFSFGGNTVTSFTNAGTYSDITVNVLKDGFSVATTGNTAGTLTIDKKAVTVSGITAADKAYDGTRDAVVNTSNAVYTGLVMGESLTTSATGQFADKNASDNAQTVSLTATTSAGANTLLSNYTVTEQATATAKINKKAVTVSGITAADKAYDGTRDAVVNTSNAVYTGLVMGESLTTSATGQFADKNASDNAQTVSLTATTSAGANTLLSNYTVTEQATATAKINKKAVTVSGITAADKTYNGMLDAVVNASNTVYTGLVMGESLTTSATGQFADKNASDTAKTVNLTATTSAGANTLLSNYSVTEQATAAAKINRKAITVSGITAADKAYDGMLDATVNTSNAVYTGLVMGESLTTSATGQFADKNASDNAQTVSLTATTSAGANTLLSNYTVTEQAAATAKINRKAVTVSGIAAADKAYDGTLDAVVNTANAVYTGLVTGEALTTSATGTFADKNASDNPQTVNLTATTSAGASTLLSNYTVTEQTTATAKINRKAVTVSGITAADKTYNGMLDAVVNTSNTVYTGLVMGESLTTSATGEFADKNASDNAQTVNLTATTSAGANTLLSNYNITEQATAAAKINRKAVSVSGITAADKTYNGMSDATVNTSNAVYTGLVMGEALTTSATGEFVDKNASDTAKTVNLTATTSAGANTLLSNYTVTEQTTATAKIDKKAVTVSGITAADKTYNGMLDATVNTSNAVYTGLVTGEALTTIATGTFVDKNASETAKIVNLNATTSAGANTLLSNYTVTEQTNTTATIGKKDITVTANTVTKTYDGTTSATGTATVGSLATNDVVNNAGSQAFVDQNAGMNKVVEASGVTIKDNTNADMTANYNITYVDNTSSTINQAELTYVAQPVKVLQGQTPVLTGTVTGFVNGETLATVFSNSPTWTTTGNINAAGTYAVNGAGLSAQDANTAAANYFVTQASANATALVVNPLIITPPVSAGGVDSNNVINGAKSALPRLVVLPAQLQTINTNAEEVTFVNSNFASLNDVVQSIRLGVLTVTDGGVNVGVNTAQ